MKTLLLIDGAAGTGKSDLANYLATRKGRSVALVPKYTTRPARREENSKGYDTDLRFPPDTRKAFQDRLKEPTFYWYTYGSKETGEHLYGFYRSDIEKALESRDIAVLIVRNLETIKTLKKDLNDIRCISVFVYTDRDRVVARLQNDHYTEEDIKFRLGRQPLAWADYVRNSDEYDEKIINSSDEKDFFILIDSLLKKVAKIPSDTLRVSPYQEFRLVPPLIGFKKGMVSRLSKYGYDKNVFLMMRYRPRSEKVYTFITEILESHGFRCIRADNPDWDITRNTYNPIAVLYCCKYGIALFDEVPKDDKAPKEDEYSANVAYELGMMHAQGKECLVLRHSTLEGVPFDLVKELYENYSDNLELRTIIGSWVRKL